MPTKLPRQCEDGCKDFTKLGSNHIQSRLTCLTCGHSESKPASHAVYDSSNCPHEITDYRGSSSDVKKTYCRQCQTYIDTRSVESHLETKLLAKKIMLASEVQSALIESTMYERLVNKTQVVLVMATFQGQASAHFDKQSTIDTSTLKKMLDDAVDMVVEAENPCERTAMMAPKLRAPITGVPGLDKLPIVDVLNDPGIWVCLDEACNSNCHGQGWRENAESKLKMKDVSPYFMDHMHWVHKDEKQYSGIGNATVQTMGKWKTPAMFRLQFSGKIIPIVTGE